MFSNLLRVTPRMWEIFARPGVRLATSYYSDDAGQHDAITERRDSHARTTANIAKAVRRSIPLRVGLIDIVDDQRTERARRRLAELGVTNVDIDHLRQVGRGVRDQRSGVAQLCGACAHGKLAVATNGDTPSKCGPESRCDPSKSSCSPHCPPSYHSDPKRCWPYYYEEKPK